ncbi:uncharacterized protein [Drosophila pseudoobscura]|uniref:Uncharacterized protein isoform X1 n=2 Tax=Drosophila pseudoobscura pseudoobscura TaxID=46245 RepID=A0A6I8WBM0_DROPS|nr:uncharacterized protein LOC4812917 isoform X1 [Drosophila pseudoobscura]
MIISSKMAASIYATPPPDLSSEDTALSDVSNSSTLNTNRGSNNSNNTHEATRATATAGTGAGAAAGGDGTISPTEQLVKGQEQQQEPRPKPAGSSTNEADNAEDDIETETGEGNGDRVEDGTGLEAAAETEEGATMAAMAATAAAAANAAAMQLQLLEALSDAAKKRRKQHNPIRLEALNLSGGEGEPPAEIEDRRQDTATRVDYEEKLSKMFLPKSMEKLKETFELLQQHKQEEPEQNSDPSSEHISEDKHQHQRRNPYQTYCKQCGENFETEFKLSLHMLQDHREGENQDQDRDGNEPMDFLSSIKVKLEREESPNQMQEHMQMQLDHDLSNGHGKEQEQEQEQDHWFRAMAQQQQHHSHGSALAPAFPFPPGMGPAGYLPLLGMSGFPGVDGLNRPPLRIFNPEAYCELCNKEFCNKYFLKTHKANKHGIFDPVGEPPSNTSNNNNNNTTSSNNNSNSGSSMSHMFQLQREAQPPPSVAQKTDQSAAAPPAATIHCDICSKRFTNIFAMRRHRAKQHDQAADSSPNSQPGQSRRGSPIESSPQIQSLTQQPIKQETQAEVDIPKPFQLPEGFREDFSLEQEEVNFVPPPRKLPSHLQQQARESNLSAEKLRRLGVHFPEFYCEMCHKEYANRYFLRTHKWKRHGIFVPPEDLPQIGKDETQLSGWPFMPLNLMLAKAAAAASMEQTEADQEPEQEPEPEQEQDLIEQPSKRIKLEPDLDEEKLNGSVMGLQNLQKLQSMLQQLNDINGKRPLPCHLCGRELENQYALRAHLMTEHAAQMQLPMQMPLQMAPMSMPLPEQHPQQLPLHALYQQQAAPQTPPNGGAGGARSSPGSGEEFKQHIAEAHIPRGATAPSGSPLREGFYTPERPVAPPAGAGSVPVPPPNRPAYTITPTSSYCEICNKELCNKYFMKTHMQRMHGIEIENGAQIGGVVCNICNKELCSKYFLRVHKHNTHGIIEEGSPLPQPRGQNGVKLEAAAAAAAQQAPPTQPEQELNLTPPAAPGGETNSGSVHEVCPLCARQFRSFKWLRSHLMNEHGPAGVERLRELEATQAAPAPAPSARSKPNSPTLKIPNGSNSSSNAPSATPSVGAGNPPPNLAQALQNLNAQHLFGQMQQQQGPKGMQGMPPMPPLPGMFGEQAPRFKEYQCSMCPFTTPYYAFLFIHERSHALLNSADGVEASLEAPPPPPAGRSQGKSRSKSSRVAAAPPAVEEADLHVEPTNLSTSKATTLQRTHSPPQHTPGTPSPKATGRSQSPMAASKNRSPNPGRRSSKSITPNGIGGGHRSAATSPFEVCSDLANGTGKPASYAQPDRAEEAYQMQAFHLQPADPDSEMQFAPALVYLPVRVRASESATLSFRLTPA